MRRGKSKPKPQPMKPEELAGSISSPNLFFALYEFHQGKEPVTIFSKGELIGDEVKMKWAVAGQPVVPDGAGLCPPVSRVLSQGGAMSYVSFYTAIPDVDARGFSRSVSFVIAHPSKVLIHAMQCSPVLDRVEEVLMRWQRSAMEKFRVEFGPRFWEISQIVEGRPELVARYNEMKRIVSEWEIAVVEPEDATRDIDPAKFNDINNDLRDISELANISETDLDGILSAFVKDERAALIREMANPVKCQVSMDFGGIESSYPEAMSDMFERAGEFETDMFKVRSFVEDGILAHMIFSILSGATLVVRSSKHFEEAIKFAKKMCLFVPAFIPEYLFVCDTIKADDCYEFAVVATKTLEGITFDHNVIAFLDLDENFYRGPICPQSSYVRQIIAHTCSHVGEFSFLMTAIKRMEIADNKVARLIVAWIHNVPVRYEGERGASVAITTNFFQPHDICVLRYLIYSQINKSRARCLPATSGDTCIGFVVHCP